MPELKLFKNIQFTPVDIDIATIRFKDKVREKQRQANIKKKALQQQIQSTLSRPRAKMESVPWSNQLVRKEKRQERREKKVRKREAIQKAKSAVTTNPNHVNDDDQDLDDIDEDYRTIKLEKRLGKRLKSGIISKKEFEEAVGERDFEMDQSD